MNIHAMAVYIYVAILLVYAWKDWFKSLCGLIMLTAVIGHPFFPKSFESIQGLNLWNIVFANVFLAWLTNRRRQGLLWDMPTNINIFLVLWLGVILVGWVRMMVDRSHLASSYFTLTVLISDQLINTIKWPIVGLLLFDGCRTRYRIKVAIACILLFFALFSVQIARSVPRRAVLYPKEVRHRQNLSTDVSISPNGAGKMMSGVPWAMLAIIPLLKKWKYRFLIISACVASIYALALTGSRSGYLACGVTIVLLCFLRWRRYLLLLPFMVLILPIVFPGSTERMLSGIGVPNFAGEKITDKEKVTSGRNMIWPVVIDKICESPVLGFGREAMERTGLRKKLEDKYGVGQGLDVAHPHQAYLQVLLENGLIGFVIIVSFHIVIWVYSARLFVDRGDPLYTAAGGLALALLTGHLLAQMGGQSFYPRKIDVGLWCAIGVMLRLYVARSRFVAKVNGTSVAGTCITKDITFSQTSFGWVNS